MEMQNPPARQEQATQNPLVKILDENDLIECRMVAGDFASACGFSELDRVRITTAVSEIVRNMIVNAGSGEMWLCFEGGVLTVIVTDNGPGIPDIAKALSDGFSTTGGLGLGLAGSRRLMGDLQVNSEPGKGTTVTMRKGLNGRASMDGVPAAHRERVGSGVEDHSRSH